MSEINEEGLSPINKKGLIEKHGRECIITRTKDRYIRARGRIVYDPRSDRLSLESEDDHRSEDYAFFTIQTGDELEEVMPKNAPTETKVDPHRYCVDLTE